MISARILIVDDEPDTLDSLTRILRHEGYRCCSATDARKAVELIEGQRPDLLLTDLNMPKTDGMELLRRAHEIDRPCP